MSRYVETIKKEILSWPYVTMKYIDLEVSKFVKQKRNETYGDRLADLPGP
jgi:hypothetical protein